MRTHSVDLHGAASIASSGVSRAPLPIRHGRIGASPSRRALRIDVRDHLVFPGLINSHDHLHVNAVPPLETTAPFENSYAWIEAFQAHFRHPGVDAALRIPKPLRLRHGALKNLLAGVTCVVHHDPWHRAFEAAEFPVTVPRGFGWSYMLGGPDYGPPVLRSFSDTPADRPWMIHLAEGTDVVARAELGQLERLGCLAPNSVLIHGVGLSGRDIERVIAVGAAVVWCPRSNLTLLGRTLDPRRLCEAGRLALGSDSRLSGARDLLEELRVVLDGFGLAPRQLLGLATTAAARILRLPRRGCIEPGAHADLVIVEDRGGDEARSLLGIQRHQIRAVVRNGLPRIADPDFAGWFAAAGVEAIPAMLDGAPKLLARDLAEPSLVGLEPGLELASARAGHVPDHVLEASIR